MKTPKPPDSMRSALMSRVRQKGTSAELAVGAALRSLGLSYRLNVRALPGSPDFANRSAKWGVFVHGCFWHHHTNCKRATVPKTNEHFWRTKFAANRVRDAKAIRSMRGSGFRLAVIWECETENPITLHAKLLHILEPRRINMGEPINHRRVVMDIAGLRSRRG